VIGGPIAIVLYVLSTGPVDYLHDQELLPDGAYGAFIRFYAPLRWMTARLPEPVRNALNWYHTRWWFPPPERVIVLAAVGTIVGAASVWCGVRWLNRKRVVPFAPTSDTKPRAN
jgi:hypothetical protein